MSKGANPLKMVFTKKYLQIFLLLQSFGTTVQNFRSLSVFVILYEFFRISNLTNRHDRNIRNMIKSPYDLMENFMLTPKKFKAPTIVRKCISIVSKTKS